MGDLEKIRDNDTITPDTNPAGSDGDVQFNDDGSFGANSLLTWDDTNERLGVGLDTPTCTLDVFDDDTQAGSPGTVVFRMGTIQQGNQLIFYDRQSAFFREGISVGGMHIGRTATDINRIESQQDIISYIDWWDDDQNLNLNTRNGSVAITALSASADICVIRGASSQTGDLLQFHDSSDTVLRAITSDAKHELLPASATTDTAPNDDTTTKKISIQKLSSAPTNAAYIAFSNNPGSDTFYLVLEEG